MITKYFNGLAKPITFNQALMLQEYTKQTLINDKVKIEEVFVGQEISHINYYLDNDENQIQIRQKYINNSITFFKNEVINGIFKKYDKETYSRDNELVEKHLVVLKNDNPHPIYFKSINPVTNDLIYLEKVHYDEQNEITYEFIYDNLTGSFEELTVLDPNNVVDTDHHIIMPDEIGVGNNAYDFSWNGFEYYQNAEPVIPN
jgi:hypothetical protein